MVALIAVLLAAPPVPVTQRGAWLEMQAGPQVLFRDRRAGVGPEVRLDLGLGFNERLAAEAWISGAFDPAPLPSPSTPAMRSGAPSGACAATSRWIKPARKRPPSRSGARSAARGSTRCPLSLQ